MAMARESALLEGRADPLRVEGAPFPPLDPSRHEDEQPRPRRPVRRTRRARLLREPSRPAEVGRAGDPDPHGNPEPVIFHSYEPSGGLTKSLTNAADMSGADTE